MNRMFLLRREFLRFVTHTHTKKVPDIFGTIICPGFGLYIELIIINCRMSIIRESKSNDKLCWVLR